MDFTKFSCDYHLSNIIALGFVLCQKILKGFYTIIGSYNAFNMRDMADIRHFFIAPLAGCDERKDYQHQ